MLSGTHLMHSQCVVKSKNCLSHRLLPPEFLCECKWVGGNRQFRAEMCCVVLQNLHFQRFHLRASGAETLSKCPKITLIGADIQWRWQKWLFWKPEMCDTNAVHCKVSLFAVREQSDLKQNSQVSTLAAASVAGSILPGKRCLFNVSPTHASPILVTGGLHFFAVLHHMFRIWIFAPCLKTSFWMNM